MKKHIPLLTVCLALACGLLTSVLMSGSDSKSRSVTQSQEGITITDDLGRTITLAKPARRIISTYSANTETLLWLGVKQHLVGVSNRDAEVLGVSGVGSHVRPDIEAILACKPDLVIVSASRKSAAEKLLPFLNENGIALAALYPRTVDQVFTNIKRLALLTGIEPPSQKLTEMKVQLKEIDEAVSTIPTEQKKKVFFEVNSLKLLTCGSKSFAYDVIVRAGGLPLSTIDTTVHSFDLESLIAAAPDYYIQQKGAMNKSPIPPNTREIIKDLQCVQTGNWALVDEAVVSRPGPQAVEAVALVYQLLHGPKQ